MKVAIVNDMKLAVEAMRRALQVTGRHTVAWVASDGADAVRLARLEPVDVILMDLVMPRMDGIEATKRIMQESPCAILIVTATVGGYAHKVGLALQNGAIDAVQTPILGAKGDLVAAEPFLARIDQIASEQSKLERPADLARPASGSRLRLLVAIGASAGGPAALSRILADLPVRTSASIVIVQHVDAEFAPAMADWLNDQSGLPVRLAADGSALAEGTALVAAGDRHLILRPGGTLAYTAEPRDLIHRPSIDIFFESVARHWKGPAMGILLTGMGRDGAAGLKSLRDAGLATIAQDQNTSMVYGMPKAAAELNAAGSILPLDRIGAAIRARMERVP